MKIVSSAIKFQVLGSDYFQIMCGKRHRDVLLYMFSLGIKYNKQTAVQGFLTDSDQFVDRKIARVIAENNGQIIFNEHNKSMDELFSEDLWPD